MGFSRCFTRQQFLNAINKFIPIVNEMETTALTNVNFPGYLVNQSMPAFLHFHTSTHVSDANIKDQKAALIVTMAKQDLFNKMSLTKNQFNTCVRRVGGSIDISFLCSAKTVPCKFNTTKYVSY